MFFSMWPLEIVRAIRVLIHHPAAKIFLKQVNLPASGSTNRFDPANETIAPMILVSFSQLTERYFGNRPTEIVNFLSVYLYWRTFQFAVQFVYVVSEIQFTQAKVRYPYRNTIYIVTIFYIPVVSDVVQRMYVHRRGISMKIPYPY